MQTSCSGFVQSSFARASTPLVETSMQQPGTRNPIGDVFHNTDMLFRAEEGPPLCGRGPLPGSGLMSAASGRYRGTESEGLMKRFGACDIDHLGLGLRPGDQNNHYPFDAPQPRQRRPQRPNQQRCEAQRDRAKGVGVATGALP